MRSAAAQMNGRKTFPPIFCHAIEREAVVYILLTEISSQRDEGRTSYTSCRALSKSDEASERVKGEIPR